MLRSLSSGAAVVAGAALVAGCQSGTTGAAVVPSQGASTPAGTHSPTMYVDEGNGDLGLRELADAADLVVGGTVLAVDRAERVGPDRDLTAAVVTLKVETLIRGKAGTTVPVVLVTGVSGKPFAVPGLPVPAVGTRGIWMLDDVGSDMGIDAYHPASLSGEILFDAEGRIVADGLRSADLPRGRQEAEELGTRDEVLERLGS